MNKDSKMLFEAYKALKENKLENMSPEEREAYETELDKKESYKDSLTRHNSEDAEANNLVPAEEFMNRINKEFKSDYNNSHTVYFGKITEGERTGQMYALVYSSEKYDDGDRWLYDEHQQLFYNKPGSDGRWFESSEFLSEKQAKVWEDKAIKEHPELNKKNIEAKNYVSPYTKKNSSENAEEKALDAIGDKRVTKEQAREIADKYTDWNHSELIKMSSAYNNGFNHELQGIADYNDYEDGTLDHYMYEFGQYEALTSH